MITLRTSRRRIRTLVKGKSRMPVFVDDYDYVVRKGNLEDLGAKAGTINVQGSGGDNLYLRTFGYGIAVDLTTGTDLLPPLIIPFKATTLVKVYAKAKVAPTGQDAIADIMLLGTSILGATKVVIPAGSVAPITPLDTFDTRNFTENQVLTFNMNQVGSLAAGQTLVVTLKFRVNKV